MVITLEKKCTKDSKEEKEEEKNREGEREMRQYCLRIRRRPFMEFQLENNY